MVYPESIPIFTVGPPLRFLVYKLGFIALLLKLSQLKSNAAN